METTTISKLILLDKPLAKAIDTSHLRRTFETLLVTSYASLVIQSTIAVRSLGCSVGEKMSPCWCSDWQPAEVISDAFYSQIHDV